MAGEASTPDVGDVRAVSLVPSMPFPFQCVWNRGFRCQFVSIAAPHECTDQDVDPAISRQL